MSDQIINHFLILQEFIEKVSKKYKTHSIKLNAISDHINNNIDTDIENLKTVNNSQNTRLNALSNQTLNNSNRIDNLEQSILHQNNIELQLNNYDEISYLSSYTLLIK